MNAVFLYFFPALSLVLLSGPRVYANSLANDSSSSTPLTAAASPTKAHHPDDDDDLLIIEAEDDDDDLIIIDEDSSLQKDPDFAIPKKIVSDPIATLKQFWQDSVKISPDLLLRPALQPALGFGYDAWRNLAQAQLTIDVKPQSFWRLHADGFARAYMRSSLPTLSGSAPDDTDLSRSDLYHFNSELDLGEFYLKMTGSMGSLSMGRQLYNWSLSDLSRFADLLNPVDQRAGLLLPDAGQGRLPVWSMSGRLLVKGLALRAVFVPFFQPPRSTFFASEARAFDPLAGSQAWLSSEQNWQQRGLARRYRLSLQAQQSPKPDLSSAELALRASGSAGGVDLGVQVFWGHDRNPAISADPAMEHVLAAANDGRVDAEIIRAFAPQCDESNFADCPAMDQFVRFDYQRSLVGQIDGTTSIGPALVNVQFSAAPLTSSLPGAVVPIVHIPSGRLQTQRLSRLNASLSLESGYGEWIQGNLEFIDLAFLNVPTGVRIAQVEPIDSDSSFARTVHRFAIAMRLRGRLFDSQLLWQVAALASPVQRDYFLSPRLVYDWIFGQELSLGAELLGGPAGSQGGFYAPASRLFMQWGWRI